MAFICVVSEARVAGVPTPTVGQLVEPKGAKGMSRIKVSRLARCLDAEVIAFCERPLDRLSRFIWLDTLYPAVMDGQRVLDPVVLVAIGVNQRGYRKVLGLELADGQMESAWSGFLNFCAGVALHACARPSVKRCVSG